MDDLNRRIDALSTRLRLQTLVTFGALAILVFAAGGADVVAKSLVAPDGWSVNTKNVMGSMTNRLSVETDTDIAQIKILNASLVLEKRTNAPWTADPTNEGALYYDNNSNSLKLSNGNSWVETGAGLVFLQKKTVLAPTPVSTVSFTGLNGDADGIYFMVMRIKNASSATNEQYRLRPNNLTTNQRSRGWVMTDAFAITAWNDLTLNRTGSAGAGGTMMFTAWFNARRPSEGQSFSRTLRVQHTRTLTNWVESGGSSGVWFDPTANVTQLVIELYFAPSNCRFG